MRIDERNARSDLMVGIGPRDHIQGALDARVTIVEYGDYECPYSGEAQPIIADIQKNLGNRLCYVYRHFPLTRVHRHAFSAAEAAEAAGVQDKFWDMHRLIYEYQDALEEADLIAYARELGLNASYFARDLRSGTHTPRIREDIASGRESGVDGTPSFFVNGIYYDDIESVVAALSKH